jgi:hypothetical protein
MSRKRLSAFILAGILLRKCKASISRYETMPDFELFIRSLSQAAEPTCPKCGSPRVKKAISLFGVGNSTFAP